MALMNSSINQIISLIDMQKTHGRVAYALRNAHKDFTFVLFEYTSSSPDALISQEEMLPSRVSIQSVLSDPVILNSLTRLLCPNDNFLLHVRRKIDHSVPGGLPTEKRQFVMKVYSDPCNDMSSITMNSNHFTY